MAILFLVTCSGVARNSSKGGHPVQEDFVLGLREARAALGSSAISHMLSWKVNSWISS